MKKHLLIATAIIVSATGFAQSNRKALVNKPIKASQQVAVMDHDAFPVAGTKGVQGPVTPPHSSAVCTPVKFTSAINVLTVGGGVTTFQQNCLSYNKDLNANLWMSRVSQDWTFPGKTTGAIQATWYDITNNVWDSMIIYRDSANGHAGRYPSGVLYNPTGNSSLSGSEMVGIGSVTAGSGWIGEWWSHRMPTGNYHSTNIPNDVTFVAAGTAPFGNAGNSATNNGFINVDMQQVGQKVMVASAMWDYTATTEVKGGIVAKASYASGNFTWTADSLVPGFMSNAGGLMSDAQGPRVAFDPTGTIGYAVFNGRLSTTYGNSADSTLMPIVYKSTDGGSTWTGPLMAGYDWSTQHPECLKNVGALLASPGRRMTPNLGHGIDVAVDANGVLHYVTTITMPYEDGNYAGGVFDSLQFTYTYKWDYINNHPIIWDLMTDGTCWKTLLVDSIQTAYLGADPASDTTATYNTWQNGSTFFPYGAHITVSRSTDGNAIFYGWGDSDPSVTGTAFNTQPDLWMKAYDVSTNKLSATSNITNGIGTCWFSYLSDISYSSGGSWVVPFVYTVGRNQVSPGVYDGAQPVDFYYGNCATFNSTNITIPAVVNTGVNDIACAIGIKTNNNYVASVGNFPNPFNHTTNIVVNLNEGKAIDLKVYDTMGNLVFTKKVNGNVGENTIVFDGSSLAAGVYHYTVTAGYEKITQKMVIQK